MSLLLKRPGIQGDVDFEAWYVPYGTGTAYTSDVLAFTATAAQFAGAGASLTAGTLWLFTSTQPCWISQGSNPTATKTAGSAYVPANVGMLLDGAQGAKLSVLADSTSGNASLVSVTG